MYRKVSQGWLKHWDFILLDIICLHISMLLAYMLRHGFRFMYADDNYVNISIVFALTDLVVLILTEPMKNVLKRSSYRELAVTIKHTFLVAMLVSLYLFSTKMGEQFSRLFYYYLLLAYFLLGYTVRLLWKVHLMRRMAEGQENSLFVIASEETADAAVEKIRKGSHGACRIAGVAVVDTEISGSAASAVAQGIIQDQIQNQEEIPGNAEEKSGKQDKQNWDTKAARENEKQESDPGGEAADEACLEDIDGAGVRISCGKVSQIIKTIKQEWVDEVYIALPPEVKCPEGLLETLTDMGITVHIDLEYLYRLEGQKQFVERMAGSLVLTSSMNCASTGQAFLKRAMDILGGLVGCAITGVLCIFIGPLIYIQSPGPIFFKQTRVGKNGRKFTMYKFRSMYLDAEERKKELMEQNRIKDGLMFKLDYDPRIIGCKKLPNGRIKKGIGNFIRDWSLDEFPQFLNILKGDMSLVGTRPPTVDEWEKYEPHHRARLCIRPGLTGLWQVSGRSAITDFEEVVRMDKQYISEWSIELDVWILLKTVAVVLGKNGAM